VLIVVEGLDGAGKSTQVSMLRSYLQEKCPTLEYIHFPRYDAPVYGDLIGRFLRGDFGDIGQVHPQLVALLYAEDRRDASTAMKESLMDENTILLDRYVYSNVAYQCAKTTDESERDALRKWIIETEYEAFDIPRPDVNIFLDVPLSFVRESLSKNRGGSDRDYLHGEKDIHEADISFQEKVREEYLRLCREDPLMERVDCSDSEGRMLPAAEIFRKVRSVVDAHM